MAWKKLFHDTCTMPVEDSYNRMKDSPRSGSIWQCGSTGCTRLYFLNHDMTWMEVTEASGYLANDEDGQMLPVDKVAKEHLAKKQMLDAELKLEEAKKHNDREMNILRLRIEQLQEQLYQERNKSMWDKLRG